MTEVSFSDFYLVEKDHRDKMRANLYGGEFGSPIEGHLPQIAAEIGIQAYFAASLAAKGVKVVIETLRNKNASELSHRSSRSAFVDY